MSLNGLFQIPCDRNNRETIIGGLLLQYPFLSRETIGESLCYRPIDLLSVGNRQNAVLLSAAFHGMEWITSLILLRFMNELCECISKGRSMYGVMIGAMVNRRGIAVIPCVNPDGVEIQINGYSAAGMYQELVRSISQGNTKNWQANARGVDINHNYNADWELLHRREQENGINSPAATRYGGEYPESEPESRTIASLCRAGRFSHALAFHSQGEEIYWGSSDDNIDQAFKQAEALSRVSGYRLSHPEGLAVGGGFKDWFCQSLKKPGFTIEVGSGKNPLPITDFEDIYEKIREMLVLSILL